jgi:hypothetical protein
MAESDRSGERYLSTPEMEISSADACELYTQQDFTRLGRPDRPVPYLQRAIGFDQNDSFPILFGILSLP